MFYIKNNRKDDNLTEKTVTAHYLSSVQQTISQIIR